jgi:predicted RND superfamily exporter protein
MKEKLIKLYLTIVLDNAKRTLFVFGAIFIIFLTQIPKFKSDVSADSFLLQNDPDLLFTQKMAKKYSGGLGGDLLIIAYTPLDADLFSPKSLENLKKLSDEIEKIEGVKKVNSILNMPLLFSPKVSLTDIEGGMRTLQEPDIDIELAKKEFQTNPFYKNAFVSSDEKTTAILIMVEGNDEGTRLQKERDELKIKKLEFGLSPKEEIALFKANREYNEYKTEANKANAERIEKIRSVMDENRTGVKMFLGGASMVVVDALSFIKSDLSKFSIGVVLFLIIALWIFFRQLRWIILPVLCCGVSVLMMVGLMGFLDWRVSPISSNFVAVLLIIAMSVMIHLVVRYRELVFSYPDEEQRFLVANTVRAMFLPCLYASGTTIVAFTSFILSGIVPVESFGKIMTVGIGLAQVICFIVFPALLMLLPVTKNQYEARVNSMVTDSLANFCEKNYKAVMLASAFVCVITGYGFTQLTVENRFIDYFRPHTEIYQGMLEIDTKLGGTTPLDIIIDAPQSYFDELEAAKNSDDEFADFAAFEDEGNPLADSYWFTPSRLAQLVEIHDYLESLPETGQVLSIASTYKAVVRLNNDQPFDSLKLQLLHSFVPDDLKELMMVPYMAEDGNQVRFSIRVIDSQENLERKALLNKIQNDLVEKFNLEPKQVKPASFVVLYNNMLQSLLYSQYSTFGFVFLVILAMFVVLFGALKVSVIAIIPNLISAGVIIGLMGLIGLPLDLMTITIAAITVGIGVDDTIHYTHRFKEEFKKDQNYIAAMHRSHKSIGMSMYYTSVTIIFGFSILAASSFMPTVHFGMLTGIAMLVALISNLILLPVLLVNFKALGNPDFNDGKKQLA